MHSSMFHSLPCAVYNVIVIRILKCSLLFLQYMYIKERKSCCIVNCNEMLSFTMIHSIHTYLNCSYETTVTTHEYVFYRISQ